MKRIITKGIRTDNYEQIEGSLVEVDYKYYIIPFNSNILEDNKVILINIDKDSIVQYMEI